MSDWNDENDPAVPGDYMPPTDPPGHFAPSSTPMRDDIVFDVSDLSVDDRRALSMRLTNNGIAHRLEDPTQLTVSTAEAGATASYVEQARMRAGTAPTPPTPPTEPTPPSEAAPTSMPLRYHDAPAVPGVPDAPTPPEPVEPSAETPTTSTEPTDWFDPPPVEAVPVVDEPIVERTEAEIIDVPESEDIEEVIEEADEEDDEIVFDLASLSTEERRHLSMRLTGAGISHIWEVATDLVVSVQDAPVIESYLDEVRNPDGFADDEIVSLEEESDVDDEAVYNAMSNLYVAADKLMQKPDDEATAGNFYMAADDVEGLPAPFGFDPRVWTQVLGLADSIVNALDEEGDPDTIGNDAKTLRQLLVNYV